jgi:hypothetical protein
VQVSETLTLRKGFLFADFAGRSAGRNAAARASRRGRRRPAAALSDYTMIAQGAREWGHSMRAFVVTVALIIAAGCQAPRVRSDPRLVSEWSFRPPRNWTEAENQTWRSSGPPQLVSLQVMPARRPRNLREILDPYGTTYSRTILCHGVPALFGEWRPWFGRVVGDEIAAQHSGSIAVASYYYPRLNSPDADAERSIRSLCPKPH